MHTGLLETVLILCAKNPFTKDNENYYTVPMYLIMWLNGTGKVNNEIKKGRTIGPYEGNNLTQIIAHWIGLSHGEVIDKTKELE